MLGGLSSAPRSAALLPHLVMASRHVLYALGGAGEAIVHAHGSAKARQVPAICPVAAAMMASPKCTVLIEDIKVACRSGQ